MTVTTANSGFESAPQTQGTLKASIGILEAMFEDVSNDTVDAGFLERLGEEMRRLHAQIRAHHAADFIHLGQDGGEGCPPEFSDDITRLRGEHMHFLGELDRLIRCAEFMVDRTLEDKEVFVLRGRELLAMLRRHEAEEDRLFYLAMWRDTGGES
jgi:hypothetical protein